MMAADLIHGLVRVGRLARQALRLHQFSLREAMTSGAAP
jgi:hypothetical protein